MSDVIIVNQQELQQCVKLDHTIVEVIEKVFIALASGGVIMPAILSMNIPQSNGEIDVKTAYIPGVNGFAVKVATGFYDNPQRGLPSANGLVMLFSAITGLVEALFLDNGYLTNIRTAAAGAVAAKYLAPVKVENVGVIGTGAQARLQIQAAHLVRQFNQVLVWGRDFKKAQNCVKDLEQTLGIEARVEADPAKLVAQSQLVITTTPSRTPVIRAEWLHPGLHITAMGSDQEGKNELDPQALVAVNAYVCDNVSQCERLGELRSAIKAGVWGNNTAIELGSVLSGDVTARKSDSDITICDLTGTGAQDTAIATHALKAVKAVKSGTLFEV